MKLFMWESGRLGTGYDKMLLACFRKLFDCWVLRFPVGSFILPHKDPVEQGRHYRLNIVLKRSPGGGEFVCKDTLFEMPRVALFRPDLSEHSVTTVTGGPRYVLSIGWVLP